VVNTGAIYLHRACLRAIFEREGVIMKVLITTDLYATDTNGVVTSIKNLVDALTKRGHEVRILAVSGNRKNQVQDSVYYIKSASLEFIYPQVRMPISYSNRLIREIVKWKPDVIHSQCELFSMVFARKVSKKTKAPIVHTYHTMYEQYVGYVLPGKRFGKWVVRRLTNSRLKHTSAVIAPTHKVEKVLIGYGLDKPICVVPSGIDLSRHRTRITAEERRDMLSSLGVSEDRFVMLNLGRLGTEKNIGELLTLFATLRTKHPEAVFVIVGDGPAKGDLEKQAEQLGIREHVVFAGMVAPLETHKYYQLGDVFVSASTSETQGLTYIEAAANGLPLLCREDLCLRNVIVQGENGYQYNTDQEFLTYLSAMIKDDAWRAEAGKRSETLMQIFDKSVFGKAVEDVYRSVM
jgi:1,2-diacylglycerol 3-alpha-glucosyltransferase